MPTEDDSNHSATCTLHIRRTDGHRTMANTGIASCDKNTPNSNFANIQQKISP